jgi:hypothetical protein
VTKSAAANGADQSYRACSVKQDGRRNRRTKAAVEVIRQAIYQIVEDDPPMNVRQVFYQMVVRDVIEKTEKEYQNSAIRLLTDMRMSGDLPFEWIVDESRRVRITETCHGITDALNRTARFYRRSALDQCPDYIEIWYEKDALSGVIEGVTDEYDVPLMPSKGMSSLSFLYGTARAIERAHLRGKKTYIYQFGDHDPTGVLVPRALKRRLAEMCKTLDCPPPIIERAALTEEQITEYNLPTRPTKRDNNAHAKNFDGDSVELDALPPRVLRDMVHEVIGRHISPRELEVLRASEESEREIIRKLSTE